MSGCLRNAETKCASKIKSCVELRVCHDLSAETDEIVNVACRVVITTVAVKRTRAGNTGVERSRKRGNSSAEQPHHCPYDSLSSKSGTTIPEAESPVQENLAPPSDGKVDGGDRVQQKPAVPPGKVNLPDKDTLPGVPLSRPLNELYDGL